MSIQICIFCNFIKNKYDFSPKIALLKKFDVTKHDFWTSQINLIFSFNNIGYQTKSKNDKESKRTN